MALPKTSVHTEHVMLGEVSSSPTLVTSIVSARE